MNKTYTILGVMWYIKALICSFVWLGYKLIKILLERGE